MNFGYLVPGYHALCHNRKWYWLGLVLYGLGLFGMGFLRDRWVKIGMLVTMVSYYLILF